MYGANNVQNIAEATMLNTYNQVNRFVRQEQLHQDPTERHTHVNQDSCTKVFRVTLLLRASN